MTNQEIADGIFSDFIAEKISRSNYIKKFDQFYYLLNDDEKEMVRGRKDRRSLGEFALDIYDNTIREQFLIQSWSDMMINRGEFLSFQWQNYGTDPSGRVIIQDKYNNRSFSDFLVTTVGGKLIPDGVHRMEVKYDPSLIKATFKRCNLRAYIKQNSYLLMIMATGQLGPSGDPNRCSSLIIDDKNTRWAFASVEYMKRMLETPVVYPRETGFKPSVQFHRDQIAEYFDIYDWNKRTKR